MKITESQILEAKHQFHYIHENMTGAYWAEGSTRDYLIGDMPEALRKLAAAMGYDIVERDKQQLETIATESEQ